MLFPAEEDTLKNYLNNFNGLRIVSQERKRNERSEERKLRPRFEAKEFPGIIRLSRQKWENPSYNDSQQ